MVLVDSAQLEFPCPPLSLELLAFGEVVDGAIGSRLAGG
jgi:hypothetical protein